MFRALLCPSSGDHDYNVDYHIGRLVLRLLYDGVLVRLGWSSVRAAGYSTCCSLQPGHYSSLPAPTFQPTANQERDVQYGNQHYSRELLKMGIVVPETFWAYHKYNKK